MTNRKDQVIVVRVVEKDLPNALINVKAYVPPVPFFEDFERSQWRKIFMLQLQRVRYNHQRISLQKRPERKAD